MKSSSVLYYCLAFIIGLLAGTKSFTMFIVTIHFLITIICLFHAFNADAAKAFKLLPYLIYNEIFLRTAARFLPYLFVEYSLLTIAAILLLKKNKNIKIHSRAFVLLILFIIVEFVSSFRTEDSDMMRAIFTNSLCLVSLVIWGSSNFITSFEANSILKSIKYASIYLCGIVLVAYFTKNIDVASYSSSENVNSLAPVQLSGYLGFSCSVFFLSIMNDNERQNLLLNMVLISINAIVMILSFSRGGVYFLGTIMCLHFFFNRTHVKSYFVLLLLIPVSLGIYFYVSERTHGLIEQRYAEKGSSGRDELVKAGWILFEKEPIAGVGTGNFGREIQKRNLFSQLSGAHNEFIRIAAEEGILGVITYWGFFIVLAIEILKRKKIQREYGLYFLLFFCMIAIHNGLKISLQPFLLMLAVATPSLARVKKKVHVRVAPKLAPGY